MALPTTTARPLRHNNIPLHWMLATIGHTPTPRPLQQNHDHLGNIFKLPRRDRPLPPRTTLYRESEQMPYSTENLFLLFICLSGRSVVLCSSPVTPTALCRQFLTEDSNSYATTQRGQSTPQMRAYNQQDLSLILVSQNWVLF